MVRTLRYYWIAARGYRFTPWRSPYIQWRLETFLVRKLRISTPENSSSSAGAIATSSAFVDWAAQRRRVQRRHA